MASAVAMKVIEPRKSLEPWILDEVDYYPHQIEGIRFLYRKKSFILADDMGLGKSIQALTIIAMDIYLGRIETAIIVCPTSLKLNWADELEKFTRIPHMVLSGTPKERSKLIQKYAEQTGPRVLIVNYEQVKAHLREFNNIAFDTAVFDEAHYIKNHGSQRTKACLNMYSKRSFMLTGTPMLNKVNELWTLLHRCDPELFPSYWKFTHRYCVFGGWQNKEIVGVKNKAELQLFLDQFMLRRIKENVLNLPPVQIIQRRVELLPEQVKLYNQVVDDMRVEIDGKVEDVENPLTKYLRLKQISGTTYEFNGEDNSAKLDLACEEDAEILDNGHKLVVFTQFISVLQCYEIRMHKKGYKTFVLQGSVPPDQRTEVVRQWTDYPGAAVIVCMLQVAGVGLNMVAAQHCTFLDKLYVPGLNDQAVSRLQRIGQVGASIQVREYIAKGTVENRVEAILRGKKKLNEDIIGDGDETPYKNLVQQAMKEELAEHGQ